MANIYTIYENNIYQGRFIYEFHQSRNKIMFRIFKCTLYFLIIDHNMLVFYDDIMSTFIDYGYNT